MPSIRDIIAASKKMGSKYSKNPDLDQIILSKIMQEDRKRISKAWNVNGMPPRQRANVKQAINDISRKDKKYNRPNNLGVEEHVLLLRRFRPSALLDKIFPTRTTPHGWVRLQERDSSTDVSIDLDMFSFLDNPHGTIEGLRMIAEAEASAPGAKINFNDEYCLDVAPFMLLMECWEQMIPIFEGGYMNLPMQKVLASVGIPQAMGIGVRGVRDFEDVWAFPLARRRGAGSTASKFSYTDVQSREIVSDEFCDALDMWLSEVDMTLTSSGTGWIKNILGELLENAERHGDGGRRDGAWSVSGFMARRKDKETDEWVFHVRLGIVNFGDIFSKSLERALPEVNKQLDAYVEDMKSKGAPQSRDTLRTLAALQDGVTCVPEADAEDRGGYGLQEMLDLVALLGETGARERKPRITIVSGSSCIQLRDPYICGERMDGKDSPRVLWCNDNNSKETPPDVAYVFDLASALPGTCISIGFILDQHYYQQSSLEGAEDEDD